MKEMQIEYASCDASGMSYVWRPARAKCLGYPFLSMGEARSVLDTMRACYPRYSWSLVESK